MNYNSSFVKLLERIANMMIVSFFWVVCSIPVLTVIPATSALYHTMVKIIYGTEHGIGVTKDYFTNFKDSFVKGVILNIIVLIAIAFIATGVDTGIQIYRINIWGLLYMMLGVVITIVASVMIVYLPPVLSRFELNIGSYFRLALYFGLGKIGTSLMNVFILGFMVLLVKVIPLCILIVPALYIDLIRPSTEKKMLDFIKTNNLDPELYDAEANMEMIQEVSAADIDQKLSEKKRKKR